MNTELQAQVQDQEEVLEQKKQMADIIENSNAAYEAR